ncbi:MAG: LURP-one-related family protein [Faecalibacterium sp.]|nr:LURP-one-related family protein [Ruminococcus sp.]MCM1393021.1 LURP-one-related family protein [Ruminococcus sp.]MCM1485995.1 LURP-one-related family protein [Faecalibacterium sp.]
MKLLFKQRFFSWFDSYDIYNEYGTAVYTVEGQPAWGHKLHILDNHGRHIATLRQEIFTFLPRFNMFVGDRQVGTIKKEFTFFKPSFSIDYNGWSVNGEFFEWDYTITDYSGRTAAVISKELFNFTDTYVIDVTDDKDALYALMVTLAIDAEKCSRD